MAKNPGRILILSASYGHGHLAVGQAIKTVLDSRTDLNAKITLIDLADELRHYTNRAFTKVYERATRYTPNFFGLFFRATNNPYSQDMIRLLTMSVNYRRLKKFIYRQKPDIIISVFPGWHHLIETVVKPDEKWFTFINVLTDSLSVHSSWIGDYVDHYVTPDKKTAKIVASFGVNENKVHALGYPVNPDFATILSARNARAKLGLKTNQKIILYMASGDHFWQVQKIIKKLDRLNIEVVVVCGRNKRLYRPLQFLFKNNEHIIVTGWTDQIPSFITASDLVITKAGGSTVMECLIAKKPIIINRITPGVEEGNAKLVADSKLGYIEFNPSIITQKAEYILSNKQVFAKRLKAFRQDPKAAYRVADLISRLIK